jgi:hypothetical protein
MLLPDLVLEERRQQTVASPLLHHVHNLPYIRTDLISAILARNNVSFLGEVSTPVFVNPYLGPPTLIETNQIFMGLHRLKISLDQAEGSQNGGQNSERLFLSQVFNLRKFDRDVFHEQLGVFIFGTETLTCIHSDVVDPNEVILGVPPFIAIEIVNGWHLVKSKNFSS